MINLKNDQFDNMNVKDILKYLNKHGYTYIYNKESKDLPPEFIINVIDNPNSYPNKYRILILNGRCVASYIVEDIDTSYTTEFGVNNYIALGAVTKYLNDYDFEYDHEYEPDGDFYRFFVEVPSEMEELKILQVRDEATRMAMRLGVKVAKIY